MCHHISSIHMKKFLISLDPPVDGNSSYFFSDVQQFLHVKKSEKRRTNVFRFARTQMNTKALFENIF